jgi:hypothetical protein
MTRINCDTALEKLVEYGRRGMEPEMPLRIHVRECAACRDRFRAERNLSRHLRAMRSESAACRSSERSREILMRQFARSHPATVSARHEWVWALAVAAVLLFGFVLVRDVTRQAPRPQRQQPSVAVPAGPEEPGYLASADFQQEEGFIAVPYVPPLATGELVRVVHTELYPPALASLGVNVDPAWNTGIAADLLMGEDGFPRAVRVSSDYSDTRQF